MRHRTIALAALFMTLPACDAAKSDYDRCVAAAKTDLNAAKAACSAAVQKDPQSAAGKSAAHQLEQFATDEANAKKANDEAAARKKAEEEEARGVDVDCKTLINAFLTDKASANKRYLHKRVITSGPVEDTKFLPKGNITLCPLGSDAEGHVSGILCKLNPNTTQEAKDALKVGQRVRIAGRVDNFFGAEISVGGMSQLTIQPCEIVK